MLEYFKKLEQNACPYLHCLWLLQPKRSGNKKWPRYDGWRSNLHERVRRVTQKQFLETKKKRKWMCVIFSEKSICVVVQYIVHLFQCYRLHLFQCIQPSNHSFTKYRTNYGAKFNVIGIKKKLRVFSNFFWKVDK